MCIIGYNNRWEAKSGQSKIRFPELVGSRRYWSIKARRGPQKVTVATARKIITSLYHMLKTKTLYHQELGPDFYKEARNKNKARSMIKKLETLGYEALVFLLSF